MRVPWIGWATAVALSWGLTGPAGARPPLRVTDFDSLGAFPSTPGTYVVNTSGTPPALQTPDGTIIIGVVADRHIAVFTFDAIVIGDGMTLTASGDRPLALLSCSNVTLAGTGRINVSGTSGAGINPGNGGPGGGAGGSGRGAGGNASGGGFGGRGGGNAAGRAYGDLLRGLKGGSGGGSGGPNLGGGGGGGAIEIVALGEISVGGAGIMAMGGNGASNNPRTGSGAGGGGSGGGILLKGDFVELNSTLAARGGSGGGSFRAAGGGGGGGRVLILYGAGGVGGTGTMDVSGGSGSGNGLVGRIDILDISDSGALDAGDDEDQVSLGSVQDQTAFSRSWLFLCGLGILALGDYARRWRRSLASQKLPH